jgi:sphingomyelin phosphodiesterase
LVEDKIKQKVNSKYIFTAPGNNEYLPDHQVDPSSVPEESLKVYRVYQPDEISYTTFVSINTLFCDNMNLYLISDQTESIRQLKMLEKILEQNDNIYLMGHIALSSGSCAETYQLIFRTILNKYSHKILGQFYGHTHSDEFIVNTNPKNPKEVTSFSLLTGSLSPLGTATSRFRVYDLDEKSFSIKDYFDYELKLNE